MLGAQSAPQEKCSELLATYLGTAWHAPAARRHLHPLRYSRRMCNPRSGPSLIEDRVPAKRRKWLSKLLGRILLRKTTQARKKGPYERFHVLDRQDQPQGPAGAGTDFILDPLREASAECTTNLVEQQTREVNRRMEVRVCWFDPRGAEPAAPVPGTAE